MKIGMAWKRPKNQSFVPLQTPQSTDHSVMLSGSVKLQKSYIFFSITIFGELQ